MRLDAEYHHDDNKHAFHSRSEPGRHLQIIYYSRYILSCCFKHTRSPLNTVVIPHFYCYTRIIFF